MDMVWLVGETIFVCALVYGCYLSMTNAHLCDKGGIEREFGISSDSLPLAAGHDPRQDQRIAGDIGFLL